jgi:hypothetical protein
MLINFLYLDRGICIAAFICIKNEGATPLLVDFYNHDGTAP